MPLISGERRSRAFWWFVDNVYADHNSSRRLRTAIQSCLQSLPAGEFALNVGAARSPFKNVKCLDINPESGADFIADAHALPFADASWSLVISQEVLEHVRDMDRCVAECFRVLKPGGIFFCQMPFILGYHAVPTDYWRCTQQGMHELLTRAGFEIVEMSVSGGPAFAYHRVATEFFAILASAIHSRLYRPAKAAAALLLYPAKWLDGLLSRTAEAHRIAGGFYAVARKPAAA